MAKYITENETGSPRKQDLIEHLKKKFGGLKGELASRNISTFNLEECLFWFATNHGSEALKTEIMNQPFLVYIPSLQNSLSPTNHLYKALVEEFVYAKSE